jgi:GntR family transcriptional regulator
MAQALGFTRLTVRRSLLELASRGFLEPAEPRGWRVKPAPVSEPPSVLMSFTDLATSQGLTPSALVIAHEVRPATIPESDILRIAPGSSVTECTRLRSMDEQPIAMETVRVANSRHPWIVDFDWQSSLHAELRAHAVEPHRSDVYVDVVEGTEQDCELLGAQPGTALLRVEGVTYDGASVPVTLDEIRYHPARYRFRAVLEHHKGGGQQPA